MGLPGGLVLKRCDPFHSNDLEDSKLPWGRSEEAPIFKRGKKIYTLSYLNML